MSPGIPLVPRKSENKVIKEKQQLTGQHWKGVKELRNLCQLYK